MAAEKQKHPPAYQLLAIIRFLAADSENLIFGEHAQERMEERNISDAEVATVLRIGEISGRITPGKAEGEWRCKVVAKPRGSRQMGVVTIVMLEQSLFISTVEWEDR
jgi:hypothetical protein